MPMIPCHKITGRPPSEPMPLPPPLGAQAFASPPPRSLSRRLGAGYLSVIFQVASAAEVAENTRLAAARGPLPNASSESTLWFHPKCCFFCSQKSKHYGCDGCFSHTKYSCKCFSFSSCFLFLVAHKYPFKKFETASSRKCGGIDTDPRWPRYPRLSKIIATA